MNPPRWIWLAALIIWACLGTWLFADITVTRDLGGRIGARITEIEQLGEAEVRIIGLCASACTMYLALPNVCVAPGARLVFHGPMSLRGDPLAPAEALRWSEAMARHYPAALRQWFMQSARFQSQTLRGADMIRMGVRQCE